MKRCNWTYLTPLKQDRTYVQLHPYYGAPIFISVSLAGGRHLIKDANSFETVATAWTVETAKKKVRRILRERKSK